MPREHGAWAMLLQPFIGTVIVVGAVNWQLFATLACVVLTFLIREPLLTMARQKWVWREQHPETAQARRTFAIQLALLLGAVVPLSRAWTSTELFGLGGVAGALTVFSVTMTVHNRQRELWFQALVAAGLGLSCIAACIALLGYVPGWAWAWWALHTAHFWTGIMVVHVRLQARADARHTPGILSPALRGLTRQAKIVQSVVAVAALVLIGFKQYYYGLALLMSSAAHLRDIASAPSKASVEMTMDSVGRRALVISAAFTAILIVAELVS